MTHILPCKCSAEKDGLQFIEAGTIAATTLTTNQVKEASKRAGRGALMAAYKICIDISDSYYEKRENAKSDSESEYMDERMVASLECADAIKKLIDCKGS